MLFYGMMLSSCACIGVSVAGGFPQENIFHTPIRGKQQFLPNGNILITEWSAGRVFEVTPDGDIAWSFIHAFDDDEVIHVTQGSRYDHSYGHILEQAECQP